MAAAVTRALYMLARPLQVEGLAAHFGDHAGQKLAALLCELGLCFRCGTGGTADGTHDNASAAEGVGDPASLPASSAGGASTGGESARETGSDDDTYFFPALLEKAARPIDLLLDQDSAPHRLGRRLLARTADAMLVPGFMARLQASTAPCTCECVRGVGWGGAALVSVHARADVYVHVSSRACIVSVMCSTQVRAAEDPSFSASSDYQERLWSNGLLLQHRSAQVLIEKNQSGEADCIDLIACGAEPAGGWRALENAMALVRDVLGECCPGVSLDEWLIGGAGLQPKTCADPPACVRRSDAEAALARGDAKWPFAGRMHDIAELLGEPMRRAAEAIQPQSAPPQSASVTFPFDPASWTGPAGYLRSQLGAWAIADLAFMIGMIGSRRPAVFDRVCN